MVGKDLEGNTCNFISSSLKMGVAVPSTTAVTIYTNTCRHDLEDFNFDVFRKCVRTSGTLTPGPFTPLQLVVTTS